MPVIYSLHYLHILIATGQNECNGVLTFQAFQNDEAFILDVGTDVTAFCIQCVNPSTGIADTNISWIIDGMWSLSIRLSNT